MTYQVRTDHLIKVPSIEDEATENHSGHISLCKMSYI